MYYEVWRSFKEVLQPIVGFFSSLSLCPCFHFEFPLKLSCSSQFLSFRFCSLKSLNLCFSSILHSALVANNSCSGSIKTIQRDGIAWERGGRNAGGRSEWPTLQDVPFFLSYSEDSLRVMTLKHWSRWPWDPFYPLSRAGFLPPGWITTGWWIPVTEVKQAKLAADRKPPNKTIQEVQFNSIASSVVLRIVHAVKDEAIFGLVLGSEFRHHCHIVQQPIYSPSMFEDE